MTVIYAIHTPNVYGSPMNETALCDSHLDYAEDYVEEARGADDEPTELVHTVVKNPEGNDTECRECMWTRLALRYAAEEANA